MTKTHDCPSNHKFSASQWWHHVPDHWTVRRIRTVADMRVSNVDKHTKEGGTSRQTLQLRGCLQERQDHPTTSLHDRNSIGRRDRKIPT